MGIVEVGMMGVKPGKTPMDADSSDGKMLNDAWHAIIKAPGGPQNIYWGLSEEDSSRFWGWIDWKSLEEHEAFARSFGGKATEHFGDVFTPGFTKHAHVDTSILKSPVTEVMMAFFPDDMTGKQQAHIIKQFALFKQNALDKCAEVRGVSSGWGHEKDFPLLGSDEDRKCILFFAMIGWGSIAEHMAFRETKDFQDNIGILRNLERCIKVQMFHTKPLVLSRAT